MNDCANKAMADKERIESLTGIEHDVQITERAKDAMENYSKWFQNAMSVSPWGNVELNKKLLSYTTETLRLLSDLYRNLVKQRIWKTW